MTPWQLAKESESSQQMALFCFVNKASAYGFELAKDPEFWLPKNLGKIYKFQPVPELLWFHHIANGGSRGDTAKSRSIEGGRLKAEGVKAGVLDCFWPLRSNPFKDENDLQCVYCGLYIEMKKPALRNPKNPQAGCSDEQLAFGEFAISQGYVAKVCYDWLEAAETLEWYYNL